jgi:hypothetical protein
LNKDKQFITKGASAQLIFSILVSVRKALKIATVINSPYIFLINEKLSGFPEETIQSDFFTTVSSQYSASYRGYLCHL